jgi:DNA-3-methyladenine glycosylase
VARVLPRSFYARSAEVVAPELLGCVIETETAEGLVSVRLTEVEAYAGEGDAASHAWRGPTPRTAVMFGPPGHVYVYFTYGMHWCANLVCASDGVAAAVLLRAGEVVEGEGLARLRRGPKPPARRLASGPANLAKALGLDGGLHGEDVTRDRGRLRVRDGGARPEIVSGPRIGITRAVEVPWRFSAAGDPTVSSPRP